MLLCQYPWNSTGTGIVSFHSIVGYVLVDSKYSGAVIVTVTYICMAIVGEDDGKLMGRPQIYPISFVQVTFLHFDF